MPKYAALDEDLAVIEQYIDSQKHTKMQQLAENAVDDLNAKISQFRQTMQEGQHSHHIRTSHSDRTANCQALGHRQGGVNCGGETGNYASTAAQQQQHDCNRKQVHSRFGQVQPSCKLGADVQTSSSGTCQ